MSYETAEEIALVEDILSRWPRLHERVSIETMNSERRDVLYLLSALPPRYEPIFGAFTEANIHLEALHHHIEDLASISQSLQTDENHEPLQLLLAEGTPEGEYDYPGQYLNSVSYAPMGTLHPKEVLDSAIPVIKDCVWRLSTIFLQAGNPLPNVEMVEKIGRFLQRHMETLSGLAWLAKKLSSDSPDCRDLQLQFSCYTMYMHHIANPPVPTESERLHCMDWWYEIIRSIEEYNTGEMTGLFGVPGGFPDEEEGGVDDDDEQMYPGGEQVSEEVYPVEENDHLYGGDDEEEYPVEEHDYLYGGDDEETIWASDEDEV